MRAKLAALADQPALQFSMVVRRSRWLDGRGVVGEPSFQIGNSEWSAYSMF